jgi:transposase
MQDQRAWFTKVAFNLARSRWRRRAVERRDLTLLANRPPTAGPPDLAQSLAVRAALAPAARRRGALLSRRPGPANDRGRDAVQRGHGEEADRSRSGHAAPARLASVSRITRDDHETSIVEARMARGDLSGEEWAVPAPLLPTQPTRGGQWRDHRRLINAIYWVKCSGSPWGDLPNSTGPGRRRTKVPPVGVNGILTRLKAQVIRHGPTASEAWFHKRNLIGFHPLGCCVYSTSSALQRLRSLEFTSQL